jgi:hypothetical protein
LKVGVFNSQYIKEGRSIQRIPTPPGVVVRSPTPPSSEILLRSRTPSPIAIGGFNKLELPLYNDLPWLRLVGSPVVQKFDISGANLHSLATSPVLQTLFDQQYRNLLDFPPKPFFEISRKNQLRDTTTPYLPRSPHNDHTGVQDTSPNGITTNFSHFHILKTVFGLISNNFHTTYHALDTLITFTAEHNEALQILASLLRLRQPSTVAVAENLLNRAIIRKSRSLIEVLLDSGLDVTRHFPDRCGQSSRKPVLYAVQSGDIDIIRLVFSKHHNISSELWCENSRFCHCRNYSSIFRRAIQSGNSEIVKIILPTHPEDFLCNGKLLSYNLRFMILEGRLDFFQYLVEFAPQVLDHARRNPLPLLEAAAMSGSCVIFDTLTDMGIKLNALSGSCGGSVLTIAILASNKDLALRLLATLPNTELRNQTKRFEIIDDYYEDQSKMRLCNFSEMDALNAGIGCRDEEIVRTLLERGLVPRRTGGICPLRLAAWTGSTSCVRMLLEYGFSPIPASSSCHAYDLPNTWKSPSSINAQSSYQGCISVTPMEMSNFCTTGEPTKRSQGRSL